MFKSAFLFRANTALFARKKAFSELSYEYSVSCFRRSLDENKKNFFRAFEGRVFLFSGEQRSPVRDGAFAESARLILSPSSDIMITGH